MDQLAMAARQSGAFPCHLWGETVGCHMIRVLETAGSTLVEWGRQQQQQMAMANIIKYIIKFVVTIYVFWKILEHNLNVFLFIRAYGYYDDDNKDNDNTNNNVNNDNNGSNIINDMNNNANCNHNNNDNHNYITITNYDNKANHNSLCEQNNFF